MQYRKRPGPDPYPDEKRRSYRVTVPLTRLEWTMLADIAALENIPMAAYMRRLFTQSVEGYEPPTNGASPTPNEHQDGEGQE